MPHGFVDPLRRYPTGCASAHAPQIAEAQERAAAQAPPVEISVARIDVLLALDRRADLGRIRAPTLILAADNDYITPPCLSETRARDPRCEADRDARRRPLVYQVAC